MARILSRALFRHRYLQYPPQELSRRCFSTKPQLIEIDLSPSSSSSSSSSEEEAVGLKTLEDVIHRILVQRSAPDWLPFVPGSSFWVPPRTAPPVNVADLVYKLANPLNEEEAMSLTTLRGWPCSDFLLQDSVSAPHVGELKMPREIKVEVKVFSTSLGSSGSDGEEG